MAGWSALFWFRKAVIEPRRFGTDVPLNPDANFLLALLVLPVFWACLHAASGMYMEVRRRHRGMEVRQVVQASVGGGVLLFFLLFLDDVTRTHVDYYQAFGVWLAAHLGATLLGRWALTSAVVRRVRSGDWAYQTLLVGEPEDNRAFRDQLARTAWSASWRVVAEVSHESLGEDGAGLHAMWNGARLERAVLTTPVAGDEKTLGWMALLEGKGVELLVVPNSLDFLAGHVKTSNLFGVPLVHFSRHGMTTATKALKRALDVVVSALALFALLPVFAFLAFRIKRDSSGPVFYRQARLGLHGREFRIIKFRTMRPNSEGETPKLSSSGDPRITEVGRWLRSTRMDELPQFWNVLVGDMSLVGPRPERAFFAEQIVTKSPHFYRLQQVRPGITSWGQVMYGYAENVEEMRQRLRYDIMYLDNMSLLLDIKILLFTVRTVLRREGK